MSSVGQQQLQEVLTQGRCVVCTKSLTAGSSSSTNGCEQRRFIFEEPFQLKRALGRIFKNLAVKPEEEGTNVASLSEEWRKKPFCPMCFDIFDSVAKLHVKILELELLIQAKVETLGSVLRHSVSHVKHANSASSSIGGCSVVTQSPEFDPWTKIRKSVAHKIETGVLRNPSIILSDVSKTLCQAWEEYILPDKLTRGGTTVQGDGNHRDLSQETVVIPFEDNVCYNNESVFEVSAADDCKNCNVNQPGLVVVAEIEIPSGTTLGNVEVQTSAAEVCSQEKTETERRIPTQCSCPKEGCDFVVPIVLSEKTKATGIVRVHRSITFTRKQVVSHYMTQHLKIKMEDVKGSESKGFFYACQICDYKYPVKSPGRGYKCTYQPRLELTKHYMKMHERPRKDEEKISRVPYKFKPRILLPPRARPHLLPQPPSRPLLQFLQLLKPAKSPRPPRALPKEKKQEIVVTFVPETLYDMKNYGCPLCPFKPEFDDSWKGARRSIGLNKAYNFQRSHYTKFHLPVRKEDMKTSGDTNYFQCTLCDCQKAVKSVNASDIYKARYALSNHYIKVHHGGAETEERDVSPSRKEKPSGPNIAISCPEASCNYNVSFTDAGTPNDKSKRKRKTLLKLCKHCIVEHDYPEKPEKKKNGTTKCLEEIDGKDVFKCYRCDLVLKVDYPEDCTSDAKAAARLATFEKFLTHYIPHVLPKTEATFSYKPASFIDDKSCALKAIKCQHCSWVMKKKSTWRLRDNRQCAEQMKFNMKRHHRLEHAEIPFPSYRYYKRKRNLVKFNQKEYNSDDDSDDDYGESSDDCLTGIELNHEESDSETSDMELNAESDNKTNLVDQEKGKNVADDTAFIDDSEIAKVELEKYDPDYDIEMEEYVICDLSDSSDGSDS